MTAAPSSPLPSPLASYRSFVLSKAAPPRTLSEYEFNLAHCGLGLSTEILEVGQCFIEEDSLKEELGDLLWYLTLTADVISFSLYPAPEFDLVEEDLDFYVEQFVTAIKKVVIYNRPQNLHSVFQQMWESYLDELVACEYTLEDLIVDNMNKINKRYTASFTPEESELRKDKQ